MEGWAMFQRFNKLRIDLECDGSLVVTHEGRLTIIILNNTKNPNCMCTDSQTIRPNNRHTSHTRRDTTNRNSKITLAVWDSNKPFQVCQQRATKWDPLLANSIRGSRAYFSFFVIKYRSVIPKLCTPCHFYVKKCVQIASKVCST